ncbi:glycoside hydrolase superfamily [Phakopsora pachyrhizi]|uniref:Glycoside hydrolase superfamily n=1 Tax=Phakopsora pachyrhizi TaxID=170000 RepID=A0AAV0AQN8_PHAPC|nr:glycoside hydrolase superfamily [Phakopsora pachyrhizi]
MKELHVEPATYGKYTQVSPGETYNGNWQIGAVLEDVIQSGAVFQPAIMTKTNAGFTWNDNHQAVAVARALRKFTDANVTVWARFQHEVNWYVRDGTYVMSKKEYKEAWKVFAKAIKDIAPKVKLFWTPNVASGKNAMDEYKEWEPEDFDEVVDIVGIDWYPKTQSEATKDNFVKIMKDFHDKYASDRRPFALAEAGLHYEASHDMRVNWLDHMTQAKKELPHFLSLTWYNCKKEWDYKLVGHGLNTYKLRQKLT